MRWIFLLPIALFYSGSAYAQSISPETYAQRRDRMLDELNDGILLLHARTVEKAMEQPGWAQDASFLYFTGLTNLPGAILALDGPRHEARLFIGPPPESFGVPVADLNLEPGSATARTYHLTAVAPGDQFPSYIRQRITDGVQRLYIDGSRHPEPTGVPDSMHPVSGEQTLWRHSLAASFPDVEIRSAYEPIRRMRWVKSAEEIAILRDNAKATAAALLYGIRQVRPGLSQREAEATVITGCMQAGAEGPSFWPWMMSGPNTRIDRLVRAFFDYEHLNRTMQVGDLIRVDIGCGGRSYGGDVGRTVPASGFFTTEQREIWNLLVTAYQAGLAVVKAGVSRSEVFTASRAELQRRLSSLDTPEAQRAGEQMLDPNGGVDWHLHGVGLESGEAAFEILEAGSVFAYEPMFTFGDQAYYLEDMIVVTESGYEVLSSGLPYRADEIEAAMK